MTNYEWDGSCLIPCRAEGGKSALWGHWDGAVVRVKKKDLCLLKWVYIPGFFCFVLCFVLYCIALFCFVNSSKKKILDNI